MNLTPLEERHLAELRQYVTERAATATGTTRREPRRYIRVGLALAAGAVAVIAGVVATSGGGTGTPAYAVTVSPGGVVTITITNYEDTAQLSAELARLHIPAAAYYLREGEYCYLPAARYMSGVSSRVFWYTFTKGGWAIQGSPSLMKPGEKLVIGISTLPPKAAGQLSGDRSSMAMTTGRLTACVYQPEPLVPLPPGTPAGMVTQVGRFRFANSPQPR
jgi:hypothetical protein